MKSITNLLLLVSLSCGCAAGNLTVEPSGSKLTEKEMQFADTLSEASESGDMVPIPFVAPGESTKRVAINRAWVIVYLREEQFGRLERGYGYQTASSIMPLIITAEVHRYDDNGRKIGSRSAGSFGVYVPFIVLDLVSFKMGKAIDEVRKKSYLDGGLFVLRLPVVNVSLLRLSLSGIDFLFLPLWRRDTAPPPRRVKKE